MIEKTKVNRYSWNMFLQGYFKPSGKLEKRRIHKLARKSNLDMNRKGIYNRLGIYHEWN